MKFEYNPTIFHNAILDSGRGYFRRFREFYPGVVLVTPQEVEQAASTEIDFGQWCFERDRFLLSGKFGKFCKTKSAILLVESDEITIPGTDKTLNLLVKLAKLSFP